ncbi:carbon-nitrogen hydrolase family protein [Luedemannella flava]|uniref:Carbon-nitrogen hydrolase family protein n=1 Tax=Luedemannella flava TaxID=349316 RepID=A0ABN2LM10_9ACTN
MRAPLMIAVAQPVTVAHDVAGNAGRHADAVRAANARVVVFPELSLTGYELAADSIAPDDPSLAPIVDSCAATGSLALVGAPIDGPHIAFLAVDGAGVTVAYRKLWLGDEEARRFVPGPAPVAIEVDSWRLGLGICKDTGVAQHAKDTAALGIDAYVAGVVKHDHEADVLEERAARIAAEHGVWVAIASCAGPTGGGFDRTAGGSSIRTPAGVVVARAGIEPGDLVTGALS